METEALAAAGLAVQVDGPVATITLNRPEKRNAQTPTMWHGLAVVGAELLANESIRVVVLTGAGETFSAGLDLAMLDPSNTTGESMVDLAGATEQVFVDAVGGYQEGFTWLRDERIISIAKVRGYAVGAGFQLALSCDLIVAAENATFCMKEAALGLVPDLTGTKPLLDRVGYARALEICATARNVPATEAESLGIVMEAVPESDLDDRVDALAAHFTAPLPGAVRQVKHILLDGDQRDLDEQRLVERTAQHGRFREMAALLTQK